MVAFCYCPLSLYPKVLGVPDIPGWCHIKLLSRSIGILHLRHLELHFTARTFFVNHFPIFKNIVSFQKYFTFSVFAMWTQCFYCFHATSIDSVHLKGWRAWRYLEAIIGRIIIVISGVVKLVDGTSDFLFNPWIIIWR